MTPSLSNPLHIEQRFQGLLLALSCPSSPMQRLRELSAFLALLEPQAGQFESYVIECAQRIPPLVQRLGMPFGDPVDLQTLLQQLILLRDRVPSLQGIQGYTTSITSLRLAVATLHVFAADIPGACAALDPSFAGATPPWITAAAGGPTVHALQLLREIISAAREHNATGLSADLSRIEESWVNLLQDHPFTLAIPIAERPLQPQGKHMLSAGLRTVRFHISGYSTEQHDELLSNIAVFGPAGSLRDPMAVPSAAARALLAETHPHLCATFFLGGAEFDNRLSLHEGDSGNLGLAALMYAEILRYTEQRVHYNLLPTVALTGTVDASGAVLPVDGTTLRLKAQAVFFSHLQTFVMPRSQYGEAEKAVEELRRAYPRRRLDLIGVSHLREVFCDLRIIAQRKISFPHLLARRAWRTKTTIASSIIILALLLTIARISFGPIDGNPTGVDFAGQMMVLRNSHNEQISEVRVAPTTALLNQRDLSLDQHYKTVAIEDVDNDGLNEVIYAERRPDDAPGWDSVCCVRARTGTPLWSVPIRRSLNFPRGPHLVDERLNVTCLATGHLTGDTTVQVVVLAQHDIFPALVLQLDGATGRELGAFVNAGALYPSIQFIDLDHDGITEIVLAGTNNSLMSPVLFALHPARMKGYSPCTEQYMPEGLEPGQEEYYIKFPRTLLGSLFSGMAASASISSLAVRSRDSILVVAINDAAGAIDQDGRPMEATVYYNFGLNFALRSVVPSSNYDLLAHRMAQEGKIARVPGRDYFDGFRRELEYWDGNGWRNELATNGNHVQPERPRYFGRR